VLRHDPGFKLALGKLPGGAVGLASQPTMSHPPTTRELVRMTGALVDQYCASYPAPPVAVTLDIDETVDLQIRQLGSDPSSWGGGTLRDIGTLRDVYIAALKAADAYDVAPLLEFARS